MQYQHLNDCIYAQQDYFIELLRWPRAETHLPVRRKGSARAESLLLLKVQSFLGEYISLYFYVDVYIYKLSAKLKDGGGCPFSTYCIDK